MPAITVVVPVYGVTADQLLRCVEAAAAALSPSDELIVVFDGPPPYNASTLALPTSAKVVTNPHRLGLAANWNRCLQLGTHELIHLMHADDHVSKAFYSVVRGAFARWPNRAFAVAGAPTGSVLTVEPDVIVRLLLSKDRPPVGSVVYHRADVDAEPFSRAYPYCPDEETLPRLAADRGAILVGRDLYAESVWDGQARFSTWREADFARVYWDARMSGVRGCSHSLREFAKRETRARIISVCGHLIRVGETELARAHLRALRRLDSGASLTYRVAAATAMAQLPGGQGLLLAVDRLRGHRG